MKWVPFNEDWENKTPLFAIMPTGYPYNLENPHINEVPYSFLNSSNLIKIIKFIIYLLPSTILAIISYISKLKFWVTIPFNSSWSYNGSSTGETLPSKLSLRKDL